MAASAEKSVNGNTLVPSDALTSRSEYVDAHDPFPIEGPSLRGVLWIAFDGDRYYFYSSN